MYRTFLLFGAPGAGKGTQGKILGTIPNFFHFACGDAFRNLKIESDLGGWTVAAPPAGTGVSGNTWQRSQQALDFGAGVTTPDSVYLGFGLETLSTTQRDDLVRRALSHLKAGR